MDLQAAVAASLTKLIASGEIEQHIEKVLAKTIGSVINDVLSPYSDFGKNLTSKVKESLMLRDDIELPAYNHAILQVVRKQVDAAVAGAIQRDIGNSLEKLLESPPASIPVSKLIEQYKEWVANRNGHDECHCDGDEMEIGLAFEAKEESNGGFSFFLDPTGMDYSGKPKSQRSFEIWAGVNKEGKLYWLRLNGADVDKQIFAGPLYGFERSLFQMKVAGTILVDDREDAEITAYYSTAER